MGVPVGPRPTDAGTIVPWRLREGAAMLPSNKMRVVTICAEGATGEGIGSNAAASGRGDQR